MSITMYDCGFGDCFCLQDEYVQRPLFIDFGILSRSKVGSKKQAYRAVLQDMYNMTSSGKKGIDFLLTHYHTDHFSGLMYLIRNRKKYNALQYVRFENVYIPNVWNIAESRNVVMALLLSYLSGHGARKMNLIDFLVAICKTGGKVHLINRGSMIGDELVALWPPRDMDSGCCVWELDIADEGFLMTLGEIADELIDVVLTSILNEQDGAYTDATHRLRVLKTRFSRLGNESPRINRDIQIRLNDLGNKSSIVFHNIHEAQGRRNVLFTGDVHPQAWQRIEARSPQNRLPLHREYGVVKIPHHGTQGYYHDFALYVSSRGETVFLIPNGDIRLPGYEIAARYPQGARGAMLCCSNNNACEEALRRGCCACTPARCVSPSPSQTL